MKNKIDGVNLMVCGSQRFDDHEFVFSTLDSFHQQTRGNIRRVFTSKFSGACEYARDWTQRTNKILVPSEKIEIVDYAFDMVLEQKNHSFYEDAEIPPFAIANDPFFKKGQAELMSKGVNFVICFPNAEGKLGASTANIKRFADLADIPYFNCSELLSLVNQHRDEVINAKNEEPKVEKAQGAGFNNRHPNRR